MKPTPYSSTTKHILFEAGKGNPPGTYTARWLDGLSDALHAKLCKVGLCEPRQSEDVSEKTTLRQLGDQFLAAKADKKESTLITYRKAIDCLIRYFRADRTIESISQGDAEEWRVWLSQKGNIREGKLRKNKDGKLVRGSTELSKATVGRRTGIAIQVFGFAKRKRWIDENPFKGLCASVAPNEERSHFVDRATIAKVIEAAPDARWRVIIALARYGGVRCPSEIAGLRWQDVDLDPKRPRILIHSPKTEHHPKGAKRWSQFFPNSCRISKH